MKRILCFWLMLMLIPVQCMAIDVELVGVNESFNGYATNEQPDNLKVSGGNISWYIEQYTDGDKGIIIPLLPSDTTLSFETEIDGDYVISFDFAAIGGAFSGSVKTVDYSDNVFTPLTIGSNNGIFAQRNLRVDGFVSSESFEKMKNIAIAVHPGKGTFDVYTEGRERLSGWPIENTLSGISKVSFSFMALSDDCAILMDNVNIFAGDKPLSSYNVGEFNPEKLEKVPMQERESGGKILFYENFEGEVPRGMSIYPIDNISQIERDEDGGHLKIQRVNGTTRAFYYNINYNEKGIFYPSVVMELDIKIISSTNIQAFIFKDLSGASSINGTISGSAFVLGGKPVADLGYGRWRKLSVVTDFMGKCFKVYIDGELVAKELMFKNLLIGPPEHVRFTVPASSPADYMIDNILFYEATEPKSFSSEELGEQFGVSSSSSVLDGIFPLDAKIPGIIKGYTTLHTQTGIMYTDGTKSILNNLPYKKDEIVYVPLREISEKLGYAVGYSSETRIVSVGEKIIYLDGSDADEAKDQLEAIPEVINGCTYVPLKSFVENILGKKLFYDETCENGGMAIIGDNVFVPEEDQLQELNNFALFYRPKREEIKELFYANNAPGEHPRILVRSDDVVRLRERLKTDVQIQNWLESAKELTKENPDEIMAPALVYLLTGDKSYAKTSYDAAMRSMSNGKWADIQYLSVGEGAVYVAIAYDWLYDALTPEERKAMEEALYDQAMGDVINWYKGTVGDTSIFITQVNNWNEICNGGIAIAALAMFDVYPELCAELMEYFIRDLELPFLHSFTPDGASTESPSYYHYGKMYLYSMLCTFESALGTDFNILELSGFDKTLAYIASMHTQTGKIFGYGDYTPYLGRDRCIDPMYLWVAAKKGKKDEAAVIYHYLKTFEAYNKPIGQELAFLVLNYEPWMESEDLKMPLDNFFRKAEVGVMRQSYTDPESAYVAFKGCLAEMISSHKHMDNGMFIFESMGEMWAMDMGADSYSVYQGATLPALLSIRLPLWDMKHGRWYAFRNRATGHNTVVINPVENYPIDHDPKETSKIIKSESKEKGAIGIVDMSKVLKKDAKSAKRGFFFTDDRQSLVVRDEITLRDVSEVYWFMYTSADDMVKIDKNTALLSKNGKTMRFEFITNAKAEIEFEKAEPLDGTPGFLPNENRNKGISRITLKIKTKGDLNITAKLTPAHVEGSSVKDYNMPMDEWYIPDGALAPTTEAPEKTTLDMIYVNGKELKGFDKDTYSYRVSAVNDVNMSEEVTATSDKYDVEVVTAANAFENTKIIVKDKLDPNRLSVYVIAHDVIEKVKPIYGYKTYQIRDIEVSDIPQELNGPLNMLDNDISTRYAVSGKGQWALLDLGEEQEIDTAFIAIYLGDARRQNFNLAVSKDGENFEYVIKDGVTSGKTIDPEKHSFDCVSARYVKLELNEADVSGWNSITEFVVGKKN